MTGREGWAEAGEGSMMNSGIGEEEMSRSTMQGRERICGRRENGMNLFPCN